MTYSIRGYMPGRAFRLAMIVTLLAVFTASGIARAAEPVTARVSLFSWPGYAFWFLAKEKNLVPEVNLDIQIIEDPYQSFALMAAGKLDVTSSTAEYAPLAAAEGNPVRMVAYTNPSYGTDKIIVRPEIESAEDLKGKSVAVMEGGLTQIYMGIWLEENGVAIEDVKFVNLIMDSAMAAMLSGQVAGGEFWEPYGKNVLDNLEGSKVMATSATPYWSKTGLLADAMYMREGFIEDPNGAAALAMKAYYAAVAYWRAHPDESNEIIAKALGFSVEDVEAVIGPDGKPHKGGIVVYDFEDSARFMGVKEGDPVLAGLGQTHGQIEDHFDLTASWWVKFGLIDEKPPFDGGVSLKPMQALAASGFAAD
ncbi:NitT/TauT family transport system substrate-binding protein [Parvibaculum indicum]|uniref:ABC transporter substrate-binding protein n=1 Tax=Parvibaculum indicum TaxID=562969 RepID=UPI001965F4D6|nr:ABC transporter substrate-binding protein [Parvibaculum indicum]NIJ43367.1 NitT/TauT family transport system substrate-binding protein [Parvibaculum indicum]